MKTQVAIAVKQKTRKPVQTKKRKAIVLTETQEF